MNVEANSGLFGFDFESEGSLQIPWIMLKYNWSREIADETPVGAVAMICSQAIKLAEPLWVVPLQDKAYSDYDANSM